MITEDYVNFETAKLLKEKGFNEEVKAFYSYDPESKMYYFQEDDRWDTPNNWSEDYWSAPTLQMAIKWLRKEKGLHIGICPYDIEPRISGSIVRYLPEVYRKPTKGHELDVEGLNVRETYEQACEAAIKYCLEKLI